MLAGLRHAANRALLRVEAGLDPAFGARANPLRHLGALTIYFFWIVLVSGLYELIYFETSVHGAYESVRYMSAEQWYLAGVMRSLHRYASDAAVITMLLHLTRELLADRYRGFRWFSWFTGVPTLWLVVILGITGYWLVWDQLAVWVAVMSSELLDWLPVFTDPMARNFLTDDTVSDRFFTLMAFLHLVGLPLLLALAIWVHLHRIVRPDINPPRLLALGSLGMLLALSLIKPARSHGPADLSHVPAELHLDWLYLNVYTLLDFMPAGAVWGLLAGTSLLLMALPWLPPKRREPVAEVTPEFCNGCRRCFADCPFGAITMTAHPNQRVGRELAVVDADLCASCGICAGACPTSTPFRTAGELITGIDMPQARVRDLRTQADARAAALEGGPRIMVYGCEHGVDVSTLAGPGVAVMALSCTAMLPPAFIDYELKKGKVDGVLLTGCQVGDCHYRLGNRWVEERLAGQREPRLRSRVERSRVRVFWASATQRKALVDALEAFRRDLQAMAQPGAENAEDAQAELCEPGATHG